MSTLLWVTIAFLSGSMPLSFWLGKIALGTDIRQYGDGNPGAANIWRAGGAGWGILGVLLDAFKGAIPVGLANFVFGIEGWALATVAIAPVLGHAFSPFLGFNGGKAIAVTFGVWTGLTLWIAPTVLGLFSALYLKILKPDGWAVMAANFSLLVILVIIGNPVWLGVWFGMTIILGWRHQSDLARKPQFSWRSKNDKGG